ncbi:MAG: 2-amino-4-hydroxy-6-hydroxymethyldihydropteridine diphosphokinase [Clostridiales bacterium]|nr:2-amino-4-hydroxy-6-hydroxymethyldihydropteridine diphosphokinase [Clostridiales bacterium]
MKEKETLKKVFMSLGSNIGDREDNLVSAVRMLRDSGHIEDIKASSIYVTEPVGYADQDDFYNICISFLTDLKPLELLDLSQSIENELKRVRTIKNGPRTIDLDILLFGDEKINDKRLIVPHERMFQRAFVLIPLSELKEIDVPIPTDKSVSKLHKFTF